MIVMMCLMDMAIIMAMFQSYGNILSCLNCCDDFLIDHNKIEEDAGVLPYTIG